MHDPTRPADAEVDPSEGAIEEGAEQQQSVRADGGDGEDSEAADNAQAAE